MIDWLFNFPIEFVDGSLANFFGKMVDPLIWAELLLANVSFALLILIPGIGLSYLLQPGKLDTSLRVIMGFALGFIIPIALFYLLGFTHLYYRASWIIAGLILSAFSVWKYGGRFKKEWKKEKHKKSAWIFYSLLVLYFFVSYIAFHFQGTLDADILFGQVGPASHLFFEHAYRPFDMGVIPISRHELFPGPISFHSVFMLLWVTPWVAVTAAVVLIIPLLLNMIGRFSEDLMKGSEYVAAFLTLVTFVGFRLRGGRGTVIALIFLFAFLLLPKFYKALRGKGSAKLKELIKPIMTGSIFVSLSLYTNIEIAAFLLAIMAISFLWAWLGNEEKWMKTILASLAFGLLLYFPWFLTVSLLIFGSQLLPVFVIYFSLVLLCFLLTKLPHVKFNKKKLQWAFLSILVLVGIVALIQGHFESIFRLTGYLMYFGALSAIPILFFAFKKPDYEKQSLMIVIWLFAVSYITIYPYLRSLISSIGLPEDVQYFLLDKGVGAVLPEIRTKIHEYFLPIFGMMLIAIVLAWINKNWPWKKYLYYILVIVFLFFTAVRFHPGDQYEYPRGQTLSANIGMMIGVQLVFSDRPLWYLEEAEELVSVLNEQIEPGDRIFNLATYKDIYHPGYQFTYIALGLSSVALDEEDLVDTQYTSELLSQVIEAGANYIIVDQGIEFSEDFMDDERVEGIFVTKDYKYLLMEVL